jgi:hypothetical protein
VGRKEIMEIKVVPTRMLSSECFSVQIMGTESCESCQYKGTKECGGKKILRTGKNDNGVSIGEKGMGGL